MGRKSNAQIKKEKGTLLGSIISVVMSAIILIVAVSKQGPVGIISNNVLNFLFGKFYPILLIISIVYGLAQCFKHKFHFTFYIGVFMFTLGMIILSGILYNNDVVTWSLFLEYLKEGGLSFWKSELQEFGSGILGTGLYILLVSAIERKLTITFTVIGLIIGVFLLIPFDWYKEVFDRQKEARKLRKEEREKERLEAIKEQERIKAEKVKERQLRKEEEARKKEEENLRLAEEMNRQHELEMAKIYEEESHRDEKEEPKKETLDMSSNSAYFINLGERPQKQTNENEVKEEKLELINEDKKVIGKKVIRRNGIYKYPPMELLEKNSDTRKSNANKFNAEEKGRRLIEILKTFDINATLLNTYIGPSVTKFEIKPDTSIKVNKILTIQDNIKMELAAKDIRIEAPISGRNAVGIEIPNAENTPVRMRELVSEIGKNDFNTTFALGKGLLGNNVFCNVTKMPHLLIAGATGSGKSVCENAIITSILMKSNPDAVKLVLIDPKKVEFTPYHDIPHLLWPVITDTKMAIMMLEKLVVIMEQRYEKFASTNSKNIETYNNYVEAYNEDLEDGEEELTKMPYIIVVIDELADLMATSKNEVIGSIQRITQLARASGIHLIVATQRPSTDIINGVIKNNIPSRIAFSMPTAIDSRTILDQVGAERLLGSGDMLYSPQGEPAPIRLQGVYVTDNEIVKITDWVKKQASPNYDDTYYTIMNNNSNTGASAGTMNSSEVDPLYDEVVDFVKTSQKASTSLLQRRFGIGYNRAARLIDTLEEKNVIGPANGSKAREVLLKPDNEEE